ncbi:MAG TPA: type II secretion system protein [Tepidisphaeraceae bacterium]|nr:type II secretion system protein [Tepidisphaeraceae bacterium]
MNCFRPIPSSGFRAARRAFTVVELLVVIGIIAVLMAILVPVVGRARIAAQTTASQSQVQKISAGLNGYYHDFNAYPGIVPNSAFATNATAAMPTGLTGYTPTEDMALALLGGLAVDNTNKLVYNKDYVGTGPQTFNKLNPSKKTAYIQKGGSELPDDLGAPMTGQRPDWSAYTDSSAPEFIDQYAEPRPILYFKANAGAGAGETNVIYESAGTHKANFHYDLKGAKAYLKAANADPKQDDQFRLGASAPEVINFFSIGSAGAGGVRTARGAGSYMLVSAGADRLYGTSDDIVYTGGGGQ